MRHETRVMWRAHFEKSKAHYAAHPELYPSSGWARKWQAFPTWDQVRDDYGPDDFRMVTLPLIIYVHGGNPGASEDALYIWWGGGSKKLITYRQWIS